MRSTSLPSRWRTAAFVAALLLIPAGLVGCSKSSDKGGEDAASTTTTAAKSSSGTSATSGGSTATTQAGDTTGTSVGGGTSTVSSDKPECQGFVKFMNTSAGISTEGDSALPQVKAGFQQLYDDAPDAVKADLKSLNDAVQSVQSAQELASIDSPELTAAADRVDKWVTDNCGFSLSSSGSTSDTSGSTAGG